MYKTQKNVFEAAILMPKILLQRQLNYSKHYTLLYHMHEVINKQVKQRFISDKRERKCRLNKCLIYEQQTAVIKQFSQTASYAGKARKF